MRTLLLSFTLVVALHAQLPANLDCKCSAIGNGEYLCKCVAASGTATSEAAANKTATSPAVATNAVATPTDAAKTPAHVSIRASSARSSPEAVE